MSKCIVYTINDENEAVDLFECDREYAMKTYWNHRNKQGRYLIANITDKIKYPVKRKPRKDVRYRSSSQTFQEKN